MNRELVVIAHDMRSTHNVGSLLRTADGLGVRKVWLTGYTPYPHMEGDTRLPHIADKVGKQIHKTALGAEVHVSWQQNDDIGPVIKGLRQEGYLLAGLEQTGRSVSLPDFQPPERLALIIGREVEGIAEPILKECDALIEIPMFGAKESFNVIHAAAMALYHCRFR